MKLIAFAVGSACCLSVDAYGSPTLSRRDFGLAALSTTSAATILTQPQKRPAVAFEGSGSSAYTGKSIATKAALRKSYQERIAADVRDFNSLGSALAGGETESSDAWVYFFTQYPRRSPDDAGRTYAALADLVGHPPEGGGSKLEGGDGYLLASSFTKSGKPPENTPAVKSYNALSKAFEPIREAGQKGDAAKARAAWEKAGVLLSKFLEDVEMPGNLADPLYQ